MKNIVNRALVAKKKQFQSKSVPRGTRTIWRYLGALFILFTFAIGNVWAADNVFTFPTSGSIITQRSYSITGTGTACIDGNKIYHETNQSYAVSSDYGMETNKLGVAFKPTKDCQLAIKYGSNTTSSRTITSNFYKAADARLYQLFVDAADVDKGVSKYVLDNYTTDYSWWKDQGLIKYNSKKYQEDASNGAKAMSGETTKTGLRTAWFTNTALTIAAQSSATKVIEAADTIVIFRANQEYFIYATRSSSGVGYMQFIFAPVYTVTLNLDGGSFAETPEGWKVSGGNYTKFTASTTLPTPTKEGKDFDGWMNPSSEKVESPYAPSAAITLTAKWKDAAPRYAITYNKGEYGTGTIAGGEKVEGVAYTLSSERFTRAGYVQTGWSLTDGGTKAYDLGGSYTSDAEKEFFPVWAETSTYVASFACDAIAPAGWTFSNAGTYGDTGATADYVCNFVTAGTSTPKQDPAEGKDGTTVNDVAFAKNTNAIATYDLGAATTVTALNVTLCGGSSSAFNETIEYLGADGSTVKKTYTNSLSAGNWNDNLISKTDIVEDVRYIRVHGASKWVAMKAFSVTYVDLVTKYNVTFDKNDEGASGSQATLKYAEGAEVTLPATSTFTAPTNMEFDAWTSTDVTISDNKFTMLNKDVTIKATWKYLPKLRLEAGEGATGEAVETYHKAGSSVAVPAKPEGFSNGTKEFTGWVYSTNVEITDGAFPMPSSGLTLTAQWASATAVAQIVSGDSYETLAQAIAAATDGQTIQLLQDIDVDAQIEIAGVDITIDLNGHKIEYVGDATLPSGVILVHNGASLTINDSSDPSAGSIVSGDKAYAAVALTKLGDDASNPATLVVNGGALTGYYYGITGNGSRNNTVITINGGTITGTVGTAIYNPQVGTLTVNNGTLTGLDAAIEMRAGTLVINDGTFTATATAFSCNSNGSGSTTSGAAIAIAQHTTKKEISVTINGGTFNGVKALNESNPQVNDPAPQVTMAVTAGTFTGEVTTVDVNNFISGGTFDHEVAANQCAEGYAPKDNGDNTYGVKPLAQTFSLEDLVTAQGTGANYTTYLNNLGWTVANEDALDNLNTDKTYDNYPYLGLKFKNAEGYVAGEVEGGKLLTIKLGHMAGVAHLMVDDVKKMELDGVDAETPKVHYYYVENTANVKLLMANAGSKQTCVLKAITVADPFTVTFDANGGEAVASLNGTPSVTLPSATKGTDSFLGWFDAAEGGNKIGEAGESYTPTADIELFAHWEAVSTDARLASISFSSDAGTLAPAFDPEVTNYTYTMPYGTASVPTITGATAVNANAQAPIIGDAAAAWGEAQTVKGVAQSGAEKIYTVTILRAPKDGVSLVKIEPTSQTKGTQTGLYPNGDELTINLSSGMNLGGSGKYIGVKATENFQEGDVLHLDLNAKPNTSGSTQIILYAEKEATNEVWATGELASEAKDYYLTLPAAVNGHNELYIVRTEGNKWNGGPSVMEVTRAMNPMLTAMTIDGRTVTINEAAKTATVTIPYEADLAALTITKTIVWNDPATENSIVVNDGSAWVIGDNTYKLTDKDGDATTYTITVARDVLKHTVSFNTHGGSAVASVEVVHNEYLTAVPNEPSKEDYIFQYWSLTDGGEEVDITAVQITENKEFHAVWAPDGAIKLLDGATVNHTNYITGVTADETVEFMGNTVNYAKFSGTVSGVNGVKDLTRVIAYNATTNKTKIQISAHNNSTNGRSILVKGLVEGASAAVDLATIALGNKEDKVSEWIEFNNAANRTIYIMVSSSAGDVYFTQVKVIESGETPMKQAGEAGYSLNFNKGRFFGLASTDLAFEGLNARLSGDYTALNSGYAKLNATSMSFTVASDMNLVVTTNNNKTYYVTKGAAGTDNETAKTGVSEFDLTAGTWYITAGASDVQFTNIAFELPKCEKPVFGTMSDIDLCAGDAFTDIDGTATVSDGGVVSYKWYKEGSETVLGTAATYTPSADGNYYVVATNSLADHQDNSATSDVVTVEHFDAAAIVTAPEDIATQAGQEKTLTIVASGANLQYVWYTCDDAEGTNPVAIVPAQTTASLTVTVPDGVQYYKVAVTDDCGADLSAVVKVEGWTDLPQVDVTASTVWDMNNVSANAINLKEDYNPSKQNARLLLANIEGVNNNASFNSQALMFEGQRIGRTDNNVKYVSGQYVQFNVTVPGMVSVTFASNGDAQRTIQINGKVCSRSTNDDTYITYNVAVEPGSVEIEDVQGYVRISKIEFKAGDNYHRTVNPSYLGTLCWTNNAVLGGATLYEFAGKNEYNYLVFDEVAENRLEAGKPYIFMPENGNTLIKVYNTDDVAALTQDQEPVNHMYGTITGKTLVPGQDDEMYYFSASHIWAVKDFVVNINVPAYYCYVDYEGVLNDNPAPAPAPGRRRVTMGVQGQQVATGIEDVQGDKVQCTKMLINGQLFILRGEKMYDAKGQLVK